VPIDYPSVLDLKEQGRRFSWSGGTRCSMRSAVGMVRIRSIANELPFRV